MRRQPHRCAVTPCMPATYDVRQSGQMQWQRRSISGGYRPTFQQSTKRRQTMHTPHTPIVLGAGGQDHPIPIAPDAPRAVILTAIGFQDHDVIYCYYRCLEAGYAIDIATPEGAPVTGKYAVPLHGKMDKTGTPLRTFQELKVEHYDAVILTGGYEAPGRVRRDPTALAFVKAMAEAGKIVAGLCHGPWIMISAGILQGKTVCAYIDMRSEEH